MSINVFELYNRLSGENILFCFSGPVSQSIVEGIASTVRRKMEESETELGVVMKVFSVLVEQMQNIINYSAEGAIDAHGEDEGEIRNGITIIGQSEGKLSILSGNYVGEEEARRLSVLIEKLNAMDRDQVKAFYREQRRAEGERTSKGAGLGLIEIAKHTVRPIEYELIQTPENRIFFTIKTVI